MDSDKDAYLLKANMQRDFCEHCFDWICARNISTAHACELLASLVGNFWLLSVVKEITVEEYRAIVCGAIDKAVERLKLEENR